MLDSISVLSFFAGSGGMDLGFLGGFEFKGMRYPKLPFTILGAYENDTKCIQTYKTNVSELIEFKDLDTAQISGMEKASVLIAGFPCQDFATCGPRNGIKSKRGRLYLSMVDYMIAKGPDVVVAENVPGLANMNQGQDLSIILEDMRAAGYKVKVWTLYGPDYGIPQKRTRLFIIGVKEELSGFPVMPSKTNNPNTYRTAKWALADLEKIEDESIKNQSQYFKASRAKRGNGQGDEKLRPDEPSYTIRANAKSRVQFHYLLDRRLTVRECARLQTFPDTFEFNHSATTNIMQIGNAVPPVLAYRVAQSILKFMEKQNDGDE